MRFAVLAAGVSGAALAHAQDSYPFYGRRGYSLYGNHGPGVVFGEFNGDGRTDLAVCMEIGPTDGLRLLLNDGHGMLEPTETFIPTGDGPVWAATLHAGGGAADDLIVHHRSDESVVVVVNDGSGTFQAMPPVALPRGTEVVTLGEMDGDAEPDLLAASAAGLHLLRGLGGGLFEPPVQIAPLSGRPSRMVRASLDGDGLPDVAVLSASGAVLDVLLGDGIGGIRAVATHLLPIGAASLAAGDVDGDGMTDLAVGRVHEPEDDWCGVLLLLGDGEGFAASEIITSTAFGGLRLQPHEIRLEPIDDSDDRLDLLVLGGQGSGIAVLRGVEDADAFFAAPVLWRDLYYTRGASFADIDADGTVDLAVTGRGVNGSDVHVFLNDGSGAFHAQPEMLDIPHARFVRFADIDGRPGLDACVLADDVGDGVSILHAMLNEGGALGEPQAFPMPVDGDALALADVAGDAAPEVVAAAGALIGVLPNLGAAGGSWQGFGSTDVLARDYNDDATHVRAADFKVRTSDANTPEAEILTLGRGFSYVSRVHVQRNLGDGTFEEGATLELFEETNDWAFADIDLDGDVDLMTVSAGPYESQLQVRFNQIDPDLFTSHDRLLSQYEVVGVCAGDLTGDGYPDLITVDDGFCVQINTGAGQFLRGGCEAAEGVKLSAIGDVNADGLADVVLMTGYGQGEDLLFTFLGRGDGSFIGCFVTPVWGLEGGGAPTDLALADVDGDGRAEVVAVLDGGPEENRLAILHARPTAPEPCPADFNGDGAVDTRDVIAFLNAWSAGDPAADIDGNGVVDSRDVIAFLNLWAAGC